jgi:hypothetical protein
MAADPCQLARPQLHGSDSTIHTPWQELCGVSGAWLCPGPSYGLGRDKLSERALVLAADSARLCGWAGNAVVWNGKLRPESDLAVWPWCVVRNASCHGLAAAPLSLLKQLRCFLLALLGGCAKHPSVELGAAGCCFWSVLTRNRRQEAGYLPLAGCGNHLFSFGRLRLRSSFGGRVRWANVMLVPCGVCILRG